MLIFTHWVVQGGRWGHPGVVVVTSLVTVTRSRISCYQQPTRPLFPPSLLTPFIKEREEKWECLNVTTPESLKKSTLAKSASLLLLPRLWKLYILVTPHLPLLLRGCQSYPVSPTLPPPFVPFPLSDWAKICWYQSWYSTICCCANLANQWNSPNVGYFITRRQNFAVTTQTPDSL